VVALVGLEIVQEQMQTGGDIGKASTIDANRIEAYLEKNILLIER